MRLAYVLALGLTVAGLVHIGSLFGVPRVAAAGAYERLARIEAEGRFVLLPDQGAGADLLPFRDPAFVTAVCRFDLAHGPIRVRATLPSTYGALAIHGRHGQPFYALTDKAAARGEVEVTIFPSEEAADAEPEDAAEERPRLRIVSPTSTGFVTVRLFAAGESARPALRDVAAQATCGRAEPIGVSS